MPDNMTESAWRGTGEHITLARNKAHGLRRIGQKMEAHSVLLSAYITDLNNVRSGQVQLGRLRKAGALLYWSWLADCHAGWLWKERGSLNYNQLNVLATWQIKIAKWFPWRRPRARGASSLCVARTYRAYQDGSAKPHQLALAYILHAKMFMLTRPQRGTTEFGEVMRLVGNATALESLIREEEDRVQALRQFVRVLKDAGTIDEICDCRERGGLYLRRALELAEGEADTPSQAAQIRKLLTLRLSR